ncbi:hypothetical protein D9Q98_007125 [Chlorella vulgaris]|uniref:Uncharacterized protein n=1 Tax=Chlorella vulgaris TaxID=3077 RepID=A0A9D4YUP0_CHLVU|nr:hypothetical protein D9Q98_007125 [Chlorella vulgaris]
MLEYDDSSLLLPINASAPVDGNGGNGGKGVLRVSRYAFISGPGVGHPTIVFDEFQARVYLPAGLGGKLFKGMEQSLPPSIRGRLGCARSDSVDDAHVSNLRRWLTTLANAAAFLLTVLGGNDAIYADQPQLATKLLESRPNPPVIHLHNAKRVRREAEAHFHHVVIRGRWGVGALLQR